jgi:PhzF family phenazine biosynthesis protein
MNIIMYQVDAFTSTVFGGNPAAVCPLEHWLPDDLMQAIACENNLSETAFFVRGSEKYELRWFTPEYEIDLCGHATLATAFVIFEFFERASTTICFMTKSGELVVEKDRNALLSMDFPSRPGTLVECPPLLAPSD